MSEFRSELRVKEITDDKWMLLADLIYHSDHLNCVVRVPKGFITDYASVPRLPTIYAIAGGKGTKPAVIHDYLYHHEGHPRADCDAVFLEAMEADGQGWFIRNLMWAGVRVFGWTAYDADKPKGVLPNAADDRPTVVAGGVPNDVPGADGAEHEG